MTLPFVSVVIVTYNGAHYLPACLDALNAQTYPQERFEVIVADNGSSDGTADLLRQRYPWARCLSLGANLGFCRGNNAAIAQARGEYVVLLNNDTEPSPQWLQALVAAAEADPAVGLVSGRLQLFYDQIEFSLQADEFSVPGDPRRLGVQVYAVESGAYRGAVQHLEGFYGPERSPHGVFRWMQGQARLGVPLPRGEGDWTLTLRLSADRPDGSPAQARLFLDGRLLAAWQVASGAPQAFSLALPAATRRLGRRLEQNTGNLVRRDGSGRDRGTYVLRNEMYYEVDEGRYDRLEEVFAGCGASLLLRRAMFAEIGLLDDDFFAYYEDTDLSWRARLHGWKVVYAPQALARHIHCGTTEEWSPQFNYLTGRNRLAMVFKNGAPGQVVRVWGGYTWQALTTAARYLGSLLLRRSSRAALAAELRVYLRVIAALLRGLPALSARRRAVQRGRKMPFRQIESWFGE
ncbi:MAG: glycosyltransferase [Chloroflexi bacterium]|nr:glycosyltransferase [Chloroflexota bacterium]